jgi:hypothetical protein
MPTVKPVKPSVKPPVVAAPKMCKFGVRCNRRATCQDQHSPDVIPGVPAPPPTRKFNPRTVLAQAFQQALEISKAADGIVKISQLNKQLPPHVLAKIADAFHLDGKAHPVKITKVLRVAARLEWVWLDECVKANPDGTVREHTQVSGAKWVFNRASHTARKAQKSQPRKCQQPGCKRLVNSSDPKHVLCMPCKKSQVAASNITKICVTCHKEFSLPPHHKFTKCKECGSKAPTGPALAASAPVAKSVPVAHAGAALASAASSVVSDDDDYQSDIDMDELQQYFDDSDEDDA